MHEVKEAILQFKSENGIKYDIVYSIQTKLIF